MKHEFCRNSALPDFECNNCGEPPEAEIHQVTRCRHCMFIIDCSHIEEHPELCCDCFDLSFGQPLADINEERAAKGKPPITKEWPR